MKSALSETAPLILKRTTLGLTGSFITLGQSVAPNATAAPDQSNQSNQDPPELEEVVVEGKTETLYKPEALASPKFVAPLRDIPQTIAVIPKEVIREQNAATLRDVLKNVPGISLQAGEGGAAPGDNLSMRGFNSRNDIFIDGLRDLGNYNRDPFNTEQIEVAKGPSSANSGRGSTGGSINLATKKARLENFNNFMIGGGTDNYARTTYDLNRELTGIEGAAFRLNLMYHNANTPGRDIADQERWGISPTLSFGLDTDTRVHFSYQYQGENNTPDYGIPRQVIQGGVDLDNYYGLAFRDYEKIESHNLTFEVEHDFSEDFRVRNISRYNYTNLDLSVTAPRFVTGSDTLIRRTDWKNRDQTDSAFINQTDFNLNFDTGSFRHQLVAGMEFAYEKSDNKLRVDNNLANAPDTDLFNPSTGDRYVTDIVYTGDVVRGDATSYAFYLFDTMKINDQWQIDGGVRYDHYDLDLQTYDFTKSSDGLSYRSAITYKPVEEGSIYLGYGTSFNPGAENPSATVRGGNTQSYELDPEESWTVEFGTKWELFDQRALLSAAVFHTAKDNARTTDPVTGDTILDGDQTVRGFELGLSGQITDQWKITSAYTYLDSEIKESAVAGEVGNSLSNTPEHSLSIWNVVQFTDDLQAGLGATFVGDRQGNNANDSDRVAESYWLWDAMVGYRVNDTLSLQLNVNNLFDERYISRVGGGHSIPGEGRSAVLSARFEF
ncbi:TonB-dependent siderophore receptor [Verrucomicrobiaceae bacterium 227]